MHCHERMDQRMISETDIRRAGENGQVIEVQSDARGPRVLAVSYTHLDCPRISREFLEEERQTMGDWWFRQEYLCEFVETEDQVFTYDQVMMALSDEVKPLF